MNETLKSIAARVNIALGRIESGQINEAGDILRDLSSILPPPDQRHIDAATEAVLRDQIHA